MIPSWLHACTGALASALSFQSANDGPPGIVDYHVHYFSRPVVEAIERSGFRFAESDYQFQPGADFYDLSQLRENNNADVLVLLSGGFNFRELEEAPLNAAVEQENDRLAAAVRAHPDHLRGFCGLDPLAGHALSEAERCLGDLGLDGIKLHLPISGFDIKDPVHQDKLKALLSIVAAHSAPVLLHNATQSASGDEYAQIFLDALIEDEAEPLTLIFAHAGGSSTLGQFHFEFLSTFSKRLAGLRREGHRIYFELSGILRSDDASETERQRFAQLIRTIGIEHFLFGSDYPARNTSRHIESLRSFLPISHDELMSIVGHDIWRSP